MHILGFNTLYFTQSTLLDGVEDEEIELDDSETAFFRSPYSREKLTMREVLMVAPNDETRYLIRTPEVQDFIYNFFQCEGKVLQN